jgi:hypothetical protein
MKDRHRPDARVAMRFLGHHHPAHRPHDLLTEAECHQLVATVLLDADELAGQPATLLEPPMMPRR